MRIPIWQLDAFTSRPFGGNPAAVCLLKSWPCDDCLQQVAAENNLSETAFVVPKLATVLAADIPQCPLSRNDHS